MEERSSSSSAEQSRVRHRRLLAGTRGRTREGNGGSARACHMQERKRDRESEGPGCSGRQHGAKDVAGNSPRPSGTGGGTVAPTGESDGARVMRHCVTDRWGWAATGPGGQRRGVGGSGVSEAARCWGVDSWARPAQCRAARFKLGFKPIQNIQTVQMKFEFLQTLAGSKDTFPHSKKSK
jgi:hypothetical protein